MAKVWGYIIAAVVLVVAGYAISQQREARIHAERQVLLWKDSVKVSTAKAAASEALYEATKAAYYRQPPAVVQITKWKTRADTILSEIRVGASDTADVTEVQALFDSISVDCANRDSLSRIAMEQATAALAQKDSVIQIVTHPPQVPTKRIGYFGDAAYDFAQHGAVVNAGVYLSVGKVKPYVALGADIGNQATGHVLVGVRVEF